MDINIQKLKDDEETLKELFVLLIGCQLHKRDGFERF